MYDIIDNIEVVNDKLYCLQDGSTWPYFNPVQDFTTNVTKADAKYTTRDISAFVLF